MKTKLFPIMAVVILWTAAPVYAEGAKSFTSSGQILPDERWSNVRIYNDDTVVDMLGGHVDKMATYDYSILNVIDGDISTLNAFEFSTANVSGGEVAGLDACGNSTVNLYDAATLFAPRVWNSATLNMTGGTVHHIGSINSGTINLYGGIVSDRLVAINYSVVNVFGYDLVKTPSGGSYGYGQVYGFWLDGTAFTIDLNGAETYSHINLIPEPCSLILVALGGLFLKGKRQFYIKRI